MESKTNAPSSEGAPLRCRPQCPQDEPFLREVYGSARQDELELTGWGPEQRKLFLDLQFKAMRQGYASQFPRGEFSVLLRGDEPIGLMVVNRAEDELRMVDIALLPQYRGRGIGSFWLNKLVQEAKAAQKACRLHVFKGSRPWSLYERLGFVKIAEDGPFEHLEWRPHDAASNRASEGFSSGG
jgi:ribosomal protein S18 acetylase RimI-like enzyme